MRLARLALLTGCSLALLGMTALAASAAEPSELAIAPDWTWMPLRSAGLETGNFSQFDGTSVAEGSLGINWGGLVASEGGPFVQASINGNGSNAYARTQWELDWGYGTTYHTEATFHLASGFYGNMQGAVQLMGWDTWPASNNQMRLIIWNSDKQARLFIKRDGQDTVLTNGFEIPEGRPVQLTLQQKISNDDGWSRVYLDGNLVAEGNGPTATPYPVTRMRYGLVAIAGGQQRLPLTVFFGKVGLGLLP